MRGALKALGEQIRLNTREITAEVGGGQWSSSDEVSTRRALRSLHREGRVYCLGFDAYGSRVWCLPEHAGLLTPPWAQKRDALTPAGPVTLVEVLGLGEGWLTRAWNTQRLN